MARIIIELEKCRNNKSGLLAHNIDCPYSVSERTPRSGYAMDYYCMAVVPKRITSGYVEWSSDVNLVPEWCPFRMDREDIDEMNQVQIEKEVYGNGI